MTWNDCGEFACSPTMTHYYTVNCDSKSHQVIHTPYREREKWSRKCERVRVRATEQLRLINSQFDSNGIQFSQKYASVFVRTFFMQLPNFVWFRVSVQTEQMKMFVYWFCVFCSPRHFVKPSSPADQKFEKEKQTNWLKRKSEWNLRKFEHTKKTERNRGKKSVENWFVWVDVMPDLKKRKRKKRLLFQ